MKAVQLEQFGIEHLQPKEVPTPAIGENEVLVKTTAVSLEFHDLIIVENRMPFGIQLPAHSGFRRSRHSGKRWW